MTKAINYMSKGFPTPPHDQSLYALAADLQAMLEHAETFKRSGPILMRKVKPSEVGSKLTTFIKDEITGLPKVEGEGVTLLEGMFVLRNPTPIHTEIIDDHEQPIYNEYASNDLAYMVKAYGQATIDELTDDFQLKRKKGQFKAIQITEDLFKKFMAHDCVDDQSQVHIAVDFEPYVMFAHQGGWLNSSGYAIGIDEMMKNYEPAPSVSEALGQHGILKRTDAASSAQPALQNPSKYNHN